MREEIREEILLSVPPMIKSEVNLLRKEMKAGFKRINLKIERYNNAGIRRTNYLVSAIENYRADHEARIIRLETKEQFSN